MITHEKSRQIARYSYRESIADGKAGLLSEDSLLAAVFGYGNRHQPVDILAKNVIHWLNGQENMPSFHDLLGIPGLGKAKAAQVMAILELSHRFILKKSRVPIQKPADTLPFLACLRTKTQENLAVLTLDGAKQVIKSHFVTQGLADSSLVHPREVYSVALEDRAVSIILAHNHPSGALEPSEADFVATRALLKAGKTLGIPLLDHIIIARTGFTSLRTRNPELWATIAPE